MNLSNTISDEITVYFSLSFFDRYRFLFSHFPLHTKSILVALCLFAMVHNAHNVIFSLYVFRIYIHSYVSLCNTHKSRKDGWTEMVAPPNPDVVPAGKGIQHVSLLLFRKH